MPTLLSANTWNSPIEKWRNKKKKKTTILCNDINENIRIFNFENPIIINNYIRSANLLCFWLASVCVRVFVCMCETSYACMLMYNVSHCTVRIGWTLVWLFNRLAFVCNASDRFMSGVKIMNRFEFTDGNGKIYGVCADTFAFSHMMIVIVVYNKVLQIGATWNFSFFISFCSKYCITHRYCLSRRKNIILYVISQFFFLLFG